MVSDQQADKIPSFIALRIALLLAMLACTVSVLHASPKHTPASAAPSHDDLEVSEAIHEGGAVHTPKGPKKRAIQSFGRFESDLKQVCVALEVDGRRERLFNVAVVQKKAERACPLCRALWGTVAGACKAAVKNESPKKKEEGR